MPRAAKPRRKYQAIDQIVGMLRKLARDSQVSPSVRLKAIDRLAVIDGVYELELESPSSKDVNSLEYPPSALNDLDKDIEKQVQNFNKEMGRIHGTGSAANSQSD